MMNFKENSKMKKQTLKNSYANPLPLRENDQPDRAESAKANEIRHNKTMAA
jgi:hypothetical protein